MPKIFGYWFGRSKEQTPAQKFEELLPALMENMPRVKQLLRAAMNNETIGIAGSIRASSDGEMLGSVYDFFMNRGGPQDHFDMSDPMIAGHGITTPVPMNQITFTQQVAALPAVTVPVMSDGHVVKRDLQVKVKPAEVLEEMETLPAPIKMEALDTKIAMFEDKVELMGKGSFNHAGHQIGAMLQCLKNRKRYPEFMDFFNQFPYTDNEKIGALVTKYKLVFKQSDLFVPTLPKEATDIMKAYTAKVREITGKDPNYYVIAEEADFKKKYKQNDPILLVQSIFGFFWQILGAWDKELLLLSEL